MATLLWMAAFGPAEGATVLISEFMAVNHASLLDQDGEGSDWIELFNPGPDATSLDGWSLTDESAALTKWRFPNIQLAANGFLVIFASGKDRRVPGAELHTNFRLAAAGGYLALVRPDGTTITTEFVYGEQREDVSYGVSRELNTVPLLRTGAPLRFWVPASSSPDLSWTGGTEPFPDGEWFAATNGVGFDSSSSDFPTPIGWWNFDDASNPQLVRDASGGNRHAIVSGAPAYTAGGSGHTGLPGDRAMNFTGTGYVQVPDAGTGLFATVTTRNTITVSLWVFGAETQPAQSTAFYGSINTDGSEPRALEAHLPWDDRVIYWDTGVLGLDTRVAVLEPDNTKWKGRWNHYVFVKNGDSKEIWQNGTRILQGLNTTPLPTIRSFFIGSFGTGVGWNYQGMIDDFVVWDEALMPSQIQALASGATPRGGFGSLVQTDLRELMLGWNASVYLRLPFVLSGPADFDLLLLRMNYDDGFVCWLNGVEVARRNAPATLAFNSTAIRERTKAQARQAEDIMISDFIPWLHPGTNVLAIQGLNFDVNDEDFLALPELRTGRASSAQFFTRPTPGMANGSGIAGFVGDTHFEPNRGFYDAPLDVRIWVETPAATLVYTTDGSEPSLSNGNVVPGTQATVRVTTTTILRAAAFRDGYEPSNVDTHSYIFPAAVPNQTRPPNVGATWPGGYPTDFAMDARIINSALPGYRLTNALLDIPSVSLTLAPDDLWSAANGIYANSATLQVERAASFELVLPDGSGLGGKAGASIRGFSSEIKSLTPKHSFTVVFRREYDQPRLEFPLFPDTAVREFNALVLRGNVLDSWVNSEIDWNKQIDGDWRWQRDRASYVRDQWMRDSQLAQGQPAGHGRFVHLYLNGLYWGIYNLDERLDENFAALHFGGDASEYDVLAGGELKSGTPEAWSQLMGLSGADLSMDANYQRLLGNHANGTRNPAYPILLDVTNLVDYMILHIAAGADDWPWHNWVAIRKRTPDSTGFKFLAWDQELSINSLRKQHTDSGQLYAEVNAEHTAVYARARTNAEFRQLFADRVQRHLFNGGALSPSNNIARYDARVTEIDRAIVAESARWADFYRPAQPYRREVEWLGTNQWMRQVFFPSNHFIALQRFRNAGLLSPVNAPVLSQFGGAVPAGFSLTMTNPNVGGTLFFTLNGDDPRRPGGTLAPTAQVYGASVAINAPTLVRARVRVGTQWSALVEAMYYPPQDLSQLALTEMMYNPAPAPGTDGDEFEFIELKNRGNAPLNLSGLGFSSGITFTFTNGTVLAPGQFLVLVRNPALFATRYPDVPFQGVYSARLDNAGEALALVHPLGTGIFSVTYDDEAPWPVTADGLGWSLVPKGNFAATQAPDDGTKWRASAHPGGSPGRDDPEPAIPPIVINEILTHPELGEVDTIELFNPTALPVDVAGWFLTDEARAPRKYRIASPAIIPAGGYWITDPEQTNAFRLSSHGEQLYLFSGDANTNLTGYSHGLSFDAAPRGVSFGRHLNSAGEEQFPLQLSVSLGRDNAGPLLSDIVISEIMYHPALDGMEFLELHNRTSSRIPLFDPSHPQNAWRLAGIDYTLPANTFLEPQAYLVLVASDPASFRARYAVPTSVPVLGPYSGALQDSGERLRLQHPGTPEITPTNVLVPYITVETVRYNDKSPWAPEADGAGFSLQRLNPAVYGDDPLNWHAAEPTPGRPSLDTDADGLPDWWESAHGTDRLVADAESDSDGDGLTNLQEYRAGTNPTNSSSVFRIQSAFRESNGNLVLQFAGHAHWNYLLYVTTNLGSAAAWQPLLSRPSYRGEGIFNVTLPVTNQQQFFKLSAP